MGIILSRFPKVKQIAPVFTLIIPFGALGALAGGVGFSYLAIEHDNSLVFLGFLGGIIIGGIVGLFVGTIFASIWWFCMKKTAKRDAVINADKSANTEQRG